MRTSLIHNWTIISYRSTRIFVACGLSSSAMKSITQTRWNRGRSTRNNSWHQILPSKISKGKEKKERNSSSRRNLYPRYPPPLVGAASAGHRRWTRLAFGHRSRGEEASFPLVSPLSSPREHYPTIDHTRALERNPSLGSQARTSSSGILPLSASPPFLSRPNTTIEHTDPRFLLRFILPPWEKTLLFLSRDLPGRKENPHWIGGKSLIDLWFWCL